MLERCRRGAGKVLDRCWSDVGEVLGRCWAGAGEEQQRCWRGDGLEFLPPFIRPLLRGGRIKGGRSFSNVVLGGVVG